MQGASSCRSLPSDRRCLARPPGYSTEMTKNGRPQHTRISLQASLCPACCVVSGTWNLFRPRASRDRRIFGAFAEVVSHEAELCSGSARNSNRGPVVNSFPIFIAGFFSKRRNAFPSTKPSSPKFSDSAKTTSGVLNSLKKRSRSPQRLPKTHGILVSRPM